MGVILNAGVGRHRTCLLSKCRAWRHLKGVSVVYISTEDGPWSVILFFSEASNWRWWESVSHFLSSDKAE